MKRKMKRIIKTIVSVSLVAAMAVASFGVTNNNEAKAFSVEVDSVNGGNTFLEDGMKNATYKVGDITYNNYTLYNGVSSSSDSELQNAYNAIDGDVKTRWESQHGKDNVYLQVDLGNTYAVKMIGIYWEDASARKYTLSGSTDG